MSNKEEFSIEHQFHLYLVRMGYSETRMPRDQYHQLKQAFFGGFGQSLTVMTVEVSELPESRAMSAIDGMINQVTAFFLAESLRDN